MEVKHSICILGLFIVTLVCSHGSYTDRFHMGPRSELRAKQQSQHSRAPYNFVDEADFMGQYGMLDPEMEKTIGNRQSPIFRTTEDHNRWNVLEMAPLSSLRSLSGNRRESVGLKSPVVRTWKLGHHRPLASMLAMPTTTTTRKPPTRRLVNKQPDNRDRHLRRDRLDQEHRELHQEHKELQEQRELQEHGELQQQKELQQHKKLHQRKRQQQRELQQQKYDQVFKQPSHQVALFDQAMLAGAQEQRNHIDEKRSIGSRSQESGGYDGRRCVRDHNSCVTDCTASQKPDNGIQNVPNWCPPASPPWAPLGFNWPQFPNFYLPNFFPQPASLPCLPGLPCKELALQSTNKPEVATKSATDSTTTERPPPHLNSLASAANARSFLSSPKCNASPPTGGTNCVVPKPPGGDGKATFHVHFRNLKRDPPRPKPEGAGPSCIEGRVCKTKADLRRLLSLFQQALAANRQNASDKKSSDHDCASSSNICKRETLSTESISSNFTDESAMANSSATAASESRSPSNADAIRNFMFFILPKIEEFGRARQDNKTKTETTTSTDKEEMELNDVLELIQDPETKDVIESLKDSLNSYSRDLLRVYLQGRSVVPKDLVRIKKSEIPISIVGNLTDVVDMDALSQLVAGAANHSDDRLWSQVSGYYGRGKSSWGHPVV